MNLLEQTKYLIKQTGLKPDKFLGQNFCIDEKVIQEMVRTANLSQDDIVLEVGPGFGFLTRELLKSAGKVVAVELDKQLVKLLRRLEKVYPNLEIVEGNILQIPTFKKQETRLRLSQARGFGGQANNPQSSILNPQNHNSSFLILDSQYKIVANLPYNITSAFLKKFLTAENKPESMTLLLQKEVAERICAGPGKMSLLSISVQLYGQPKIISLVDKKSFWPMPQVDSAILQINNIRNFPFKEVAEKIFWQAVRSGFSAKRKMLKNNLAASLHRAPLEVEQILIKSGLNPQARAQELALEEWRKLSVNII